MNLSAWIGGCTGRSGVKTPPHDSADRNKPAKAESIWDAVVRKLAEAGPEPDGVLRLLGGPREGAILRGLNKTVRAECFIKERARKIGAAHEHVPTESGVEPLCVAHYLRGPGCSSGRSSGKTYGTGRMRSDMEKKTHKPSLDIKEVYAKLLHFF
jgi:hypothetical protein